MIDWNYYRSLFPVTKEHVYFMTAGAGPIPTPVLNAITDRYTQLSLHGGDIFQRNLEIVEQCREQVAKLINADKEDIAFIPNVSFGMNALANSLVEKPLLAIPEDDFPSSIVPWKNSQFDINFIPSSPDLQENLEAVADTTNQSIITSLVQYSCGYRIDPSSIKQKMQHKDTRLIVNATQGIGVFPIDVKKSNIDALICACHKWLFCGEGLAFMYIKREFFSKLRPAIIGWRSSPLAMQFNDEFRLYDSARVFEIGWSNMTIFSGLEKALDLVLEIGVANIAARVLELTNYLVDGLKERNIPTFSDHSSKNRSGIVLLGPFTDLDKMLAKLYEKNIYATKRGNGIRIAVHFYNNKDDIDSLLTTLFTLKNLI